ncbi:MAG: cytochrome c [Candidatus Binatia bacterium]
MMPTSSRRVSSSTTERALSGVVALALAALAGMLFAGPALAEDAAGGAPDVAKLWTKNCQSCHGSDGKGKTKAGEKAKVKDLTSPEVKAKMDRARIVTAIKDGVKEEGSDKMAMKAYSEKLTPAEIEALADHSMAFK